jgi:hypothetical protein
MDSKIAAVATAQKQHEATPAACLVKLMKCVQRVAMSPGSAQDHSRAHKQHD